MTTIGADDIREVTQAIWSSVLGFAVEPVGWEAPLPSGDHTLAGCVQITGAWEGAVAVRCPMPLARRVTAAMFDVDAAQATIAQAQDAIAELVNMTGGNLKGLVPEPSQLSLPSVTTGSDLAHRMPGSRLVDAVAFACDGEPFVVSVHERDPAARRGG